MDHCENKEEASYLFIKLDGIGDYLFFRLFWPQIYDAAKTKKADISLFCSNSFVSIAKKYDFKYVKKILSPDDLRIKRKYYFVPFYYIKLIKRLRNKNFIFQKRWTDIYNVQTVRDRDEENMIKDINGTRKISVKNTNTLSALVNFYKDSVYTDLFPLLMDKFILYYYKEMLEKMFNRPFKVPSLSLPFSKKDIFTVLKQYNLTEPYIVFVPFTSSAFKDWPFEHFISLAKNLSYITNLKIVFLGTAPEERLHNHTLGSNVINLINKTNLADAMKIAAGAKYAVSSDTSLMHCALIGGADTVSLSSGIGKDLFSKYPNELKVKQQIFFPSIQNEQGIGKMKSISFDSVWEYIQKNWFKS